MPEIRPEQRLSELRNRWWFPDHLHVAPLWRGLRSATGYATGVFLDLGCGNAPYRPWFEPHVQQYVTADHPLAASGAMVACSADRLPFAADQFDTVLCTQVLEHVPEPWEASTEIHRVLKPGGVLILTCPQYWPVHEQPHDYYRFTIFGLKQLFPETGWIWIDHQQQGSTWAVIGSALWQSLTPFGKVRRLIAFFINPVFLLLDRLWSDTRDTTNHLIILRKRARPA